MTKEQIIETYQKLRGETDKVVKIVDIYGELVASGAVAYDREVIWYPNHPVRAAIAAALLEHLGTKVV